LPIQKGPGSNPKSVYRIILQNPLSGLFGEIVSLNKRHYIVIITKCKSLIWQLQFMKIPASLLQIRLQAFATA